MVNCTTKQNKLNESVVKKASELLSLKDNIETVKEIVKTFIEVGEDYERQL